MNLPRLLNGCKAALGRAENWDSYFDLSRKGLQQSFLALLLSLPFYYVCAAAVQSERAKILGEASALPAAAFFIVLLLYALMFSLCAYILCLVFDRQDRFRPWVITRHWSIFFAALLAALFFGFYMAGIIPFAIANIVAFIIYMGTLVIDIRLAKKIAGFDWGAAILAACIITAMGLMMILMGISQYA